MDVLAELLPPSYLVKPENTAKDRKQKHQQYRKIKHSYVEGFSDETQSQTAIAKASNWDEVERRSGKDRREQMECRGRWLESRAEKDRRQQSKGIQIKI